MQTIKLSIRPGTQFHFGNRVPFDQSVLHSTDMQIHSDTLFSALVNIASKVGLADTIAEELKKNIISSAFYLLENANNSPVYFLPRPTVPLINCEADYKFIKQKAFVSKGVFEKSIKIKDWKKSHEVISGSNWIATIDEMKSLLRNGFDSEKATRINLFSMANIPQVRVNTTEEEHNYYQVANLQIADNRDLFPELKVHYYFVLKDKPSEILVNLLNLLPLEGIGGQRSTGCGQVKGVEISETNVFDSIKGDSFIALSKVIPAKKDVKLMGENTFYKTSIRGGRIINNSKNMRLKQIRMIDEGAVFEKKIEGSVPDLSPDNLSKEASLYLRYGKAFFIPLPKSINHA